MPQASINKKVLYVYQLYKESLARMASKPTNLSLGTKEKTQRILGQFYRNSTCSVNPEKVIYKGYHFNIRNQESSVVNITTYLTKL